MSPGFEFRLYLAGRETIESIRTIENILHFLDSELGSEYRLDIVDITRSGSHCPGEALKTLPVLMRLYPAPARQVAGDVTSYERLRHVISPSS